MLAQLAFLSALQLAGMLSAAGLARRTSAAFVACSGLLWGLMLWVAVGLVHLNAGIPCTVRTVFPSVGGLSLASAVAAVRLRAVDAAVARRLGLMYLASVVVIAAVLPLDMTAVSFDSMRQMALGRIFAEHPRVQIDALEEGFGNWAPFVPLIHAAAPMIGVDYLYALHPCIFLSLMACFLVLGRTMLRELGRPPAEALVLPILGACVLGSTFFFAYQAFYVHNSLPVTAFVTVYPTTLWLALRQRRPAWLVFSMAALTCFCLARCESVLFAAVMILPLVAAGELPYRVRLACVLPFAAAMIGWQMRLVLLIGTRADILTPQRVAAQTLLLAGTGVLAILTAWPFGRRLATASIPLALVALAFIAAGLSVARPEHMGRCATVILANLTSEGGWSAWWYLAAGLILLVWTAPPVPHQQVLTVPLWAVPLGAWAMGAMRVPYRLGFGDSANRMMTHIAPLALLYVLLRGCGAARVARSDADARRLRRRLSLLAAGAAVGLAVSVAKYRSSAFNIALIEAPAAYNSSGELSGSPFQEVLQPPSRSRGVRAAFRGPAVLTVDLGRIRRAGALLLEELDAATAFLDYAWDVSADRQNWTTVFDTRDPQACNAYRVNPLSWVHDLRQVSPFRFARLRFRSNVSGQPLALRHIAVLGSAGRLRPEKRVSRFCRDLAEEAIVIREPEFRGPPIWTGRHDFAAALQGATTEDYPMAVRPGPAEVILDFRRPLTAQTLLVEEYSPDAPLTDCVWETSSDMQTWYTVVDTGKTGRPPGPAHAPLQWCCDLSPAGSFRYLRFGFRAGGLDNTMILRRVAVLEKTPAGLGLPDCAPAGGRSGG